MIAMPPPHLILMYLDNEARRKKLVEASEAAWRHDWTDTDPGRGPVRGWGGGGRGAAR